MFPTAPRDPTAVIGRRIGAFVIDAVPVLALFFALMFSLPERTDYATAADAQDACTFVNDTVADRLCVPAESTTLVYTPGQVALLFALPAGLWLLDTAVLTGVAGGSVGKLLVGLRVVRERDGRRCGFGQGLVRGLAWLVDGFPWCFPIVGLVTGLTVRGHKRVGDLIAGTVVVDKADVGRPVVLPGAAPPAAWVPGSPWGVPPGVPTGAPSGWAPPPSWPPPTWQPPSPTPPTYPSAAPQPPAAAGGWHAPAPVAAAPPAPVPPPAGSWTTVDAPAPVAAPTPLAPEPPPAPPLDPTTAFDPGASPTEVLPTVASPPRTDDATTVVALGPGDASVPPWPAAVPPPPAPPVAEAPSSPTSPAPGAPSARSTPGVDAPMWDPERGAYIQWDPQLSLWVQWDDAAGRWTPVP